MSTTSTTPVEFDVTSRGVEKIVQAVESNKIALAAHQRSSDNWTPAQQEKLADTIDKNLPMPSILVRKYDTGVESLEDGLQRVTAMRAFIRGDVSLPSGEKFSDFSEIRKARFLTYSIPMVVYTNVNDEQAIEIFIRFQSGTALSVGQLLHAFTAKSPLVRFTKKTLLTPSEGLHDRAARTWGNRSNDDKKRNNLKNACALVAGLAFGSDKMSRKWSDFQDILTKEFDEVAVVKKIERILDIYERSAVTVPIVKKRQLGFNWNFGNGVGYIVYTVNLNEADLEPITGLYDHTSVNNRWVAFLADSRKNPERIEDVLHSTLSIARSWTPARWKNGVKSVFGVSSTPETGSTCDEDDNDDE